MFKKPSVGGWISNIDILRVRKRIRSIRNAPRTCDIDLISYRNRILSNSISIPHKSMNKRNFVLFPLFEIQKNWIHPDKKIDVKTLISLLPDRDIRSIKQI